MKNSKKLNKFKSQKKISSPDFSFLKIINPDRGTMNCVDCTIAVTKILKGEVTPKKLKPVARNPKTAVPTQPVKKHNRLVASRISSEESGDFVKLMRSINPDYTKVVCIDTPPNDINPYFDSESKKIRLSLIRSTIKELSADLLAYAPRNNPMEGNPYCSEGSAFGVIVLTLKNSHSLLGHILNYYIDDRHQKIYLLDGQKGKVVEKISDTFLQTVYWCACQPDTGFRPLVKKEKNISPFDSTSSSSSRLPSSQYFFADRSLHSSKNRKRKNPEPETAGIHLENKIPSSPELQWVLGICFAKGINGTEKNAAEAAGLFWLSAARGYAVSLNSLGYCYWNGFGVKADINEAVKLFRLAADQGVMFAQYNLGRCYQNGWGTEKDHKEAVRLFRLAAAQGHAQAQRRLDLYHARTIYGPERQWQLGICYLKGMNGAEKNAAEAARLFWLSAAQGYAVSLNSLGYCYWNGFGVETDISQAVELFRLAADQGVMSAQYNLGRCYQNGWGTEKDHKEAVRLFRLAADQGHTQAHTKALFLDSGLNQKSNLTSYI